MLTTRTFVGFFQPSLGFGFDIDDPLAQSVPFDLENEEVRVFIRTSDVGKIEGEDISIGAFDRLYFEAYGSLFEMSAAAVPEPSSWALMVAGFGLVGGAVRRRQQVA